MVFQASSSFNKRIDGEKQKTWDTRIFTWKMKKAEPKPKQIKMKPIAEDVEGYKNNGHGGGDWLLAHDFVQAVSQQNPKLLTSTIDESIESHIMGFMAEESRKTNKVMEIKM